MITASELEKALLENRVLILPFKLGALVYRVHQTYIPKDPNGWEKRWAYDMVPFTLSLWSARDAIFSTEEEAKKEVEWRQQYMVL